MRAALDRAVDRAVDVLDRADAAATRAIYAAARRVREWWTR